MEKKEINTFLIERSEINAKAVQLFFNEPKVQERIKQRRTWEKFGQAKEIGNEGITIIAKEEYFIERDTITDEIKEIVKNPQVKVKPVKCRYCNGNHMSFKCTEKTKDQNYKKSIKISNLPYDITENELYDLFYDFGDVEKVTIPHSIKYRDDICKYAFVNFKCHETALQAVQELDGTKFDYLIINVCLQ